MRTKMWARVTGFILMFYLLLLPITRGVAEEPKLQLPPMPPTIEELTGGTVKIGDLITKDNVDLVKDYLSLGVYECVKNGMVLRMAKNLPTEQLLPKFYLEATEKNRGNAVVNDHCVVRLKDGSPWPGGIPFTDPKTALEVMGYVRFGNSFDSWECLHPTLFVNKEGKCYKTGTMRIFRYNGDARLQDPPLGNIPPGNIHQKFINCFVDPLALKGLGQFNVNHVDDAVQYDTGFAYLPAFKRTIRISTTTFQDNVGGSDFTHGDPTGLREPFGTWNFKFIEKKFVLVSEPVRDRQPMLERGGLWVNPNVEWDVGKKYPQLGWKISPVYVVEATPKIADHIYNKKIIYVLHPNFASTLTDEMALVDIFDRTGSLWKGYYDWRGGTYIHPKSGFRYTCSTGYTMNDLQTGHVSHFNLFYKQINMGMTSDFVSLKTLLSLGR